MPMRFLMALVLSMLCHFTMGKPTDRRYCGEQLNTILSKFCENKFETYMRNLNEADEDFEQTFNAQPSNKPKWYIKGGVADECCINPCSMDTLASYCSSPTIDNRKHNANNNV